MPTAGALLYTFGLTYSARVPSDGFIPHGEVPMLAARFGVSRRRAFKMAALLVERVLWHELPTGYQTARLRSAKHHDGELFSPANTPPGFQVHDYLDDIRSTD